MGGGGGGGGACVHELGGGLAIRVGGGGVGRGACPCVNTAQSGTLVNCD